MSTDDPFDDPFNLGGAVTTRNPGGIPSMRSPDGVPSNPSVTAGPLGGSPAPPQPGPVGPPPQTPSSCPPKSTVFSCHKQCDEVCKEAVRRAKEELEKGGCPATIVLKTKSCPSKPRKKTRKKRGCGCTKRNVLYDQRLFIHRFNFGPYLHSSPTATLIVLRKVCGSTGRKVRKYFRPDRKSTR